MCYDRPLSALLREALPPAVTVDTWLGFRRRYAEALGIDMRFSAAADQGLWERMEVAMN